ncbi:MAG: transcription elongation factor subunit Spt4 [Candidatus Bathyarchaeia archaeon]
MAKEKACKNCHLISMGNICPGCKSSNLSEDWSGFVVVINLEKSEIARKIGAKTPGKYAIRVR